MRKLCSPMTAWSATNNINECRRPYSSDMTPLLRLPVAAPPRKHISITLSIVALSHTTSHSDWMVVSLSAESNWKRSHLTISIVWLLLCVQLIRSLIVMPVIFTISHAPNGCDKLRHSASVIDIFVVSMWSGGAHQKSRSTACEHGREKKDTRRKGNCCLLNL